MIENHEQWLQARLNGIGASEASAIVGMNPYMTNLDLWRIKTHRMIAPDISNKQCVQYGHEAEPLIRQLFALDYSDRYKVSYGGEFDMAHQPNRPWLFATLDGRLEEVDTHRKGILEIKTSAITNRAMRLKWSNGSIPDNYYIQLLHQMLATGWDFAVLHAQLSKERDGERTASRQSYFIERSEVQGDLDYLLEHECKFWECVQADKEPPLILPQI